MEAHLEDRREFDRRHAMSAGSGNGQVAARPQDVDCAPTTPRLGFGRFDLAAWDRLVRAQDDAGASTVLGGLGYGVAAQERGSGSGSGIGALTARVLSAGGARIDAWLASAPTTPGGRGPLAWRQDGHWLYGAIELDDTVGGDLQAAARAAYEAVFSTLAETGFTHLLRLWNYLPGINADGGGMERYRRFNAGRQAAFLAAGLAAFEGAPAACAIGVASGPLRVRFLAGRQAPIAIENPRQVSAYHYPPAYGPRPPTFSRAALVQAGDPAGAATGEGNVALLVSGTASIVGH
ncbi:MAG TPA: hypothetical protein VH328_02905 [Burkholderiaceae bacterium]|nr:hypothetical protein [Burkholderiaceae bacterium]